ncbi:cytochrome oxidase putative small subunit CydP [Chitinilyticum aquatile]|uniref:cytochrome oxidase putative small subunit CydP n=1 Tax=Chitinilyticum aquatile TaxID=362520 RepID=UPI000429886B|nr:cytochrome oxidase putative small subunit CydP [Chitinilyticum aquatile]
MFKSLHSGHLRWHLLAVVLIKAAVLYGLWHEFVRPYKVRISQEQMAAHLAPAPGEPAQEGKKND